MLQFLSTSRLLSTEMTAICRRSAASIGASQTFSRLFTRSICQCTKVPSIAKIKKCFDRSDLAPLARETDCPFVKTHTYFQNPECELSQRCKAVALAKLPERTDIFEYEPSEIFPVLSSLTSLEDAADLTGDKGIEAIKFLKKHIVKGALGSCLDVGGQNRLTLDKISEHYGEGDFQARLVEINLLTPFFSEEDSGISYILRDALILLSSGRYGTLVEGEEKAGLILFNNFLNVLTPEQGWEAIDTALLTMREGDYLYIAGLDEKQLERYERGVEKDGIIAYRERGKFFKTAISRKTFFAKIKEKHPDCELLFDAQDETYQVRGNRGTPLSVKPVRIILRKIASD